MTSVLFVCLGNICRSPMAEAVFRQYVKEAGLQEQIHIDSAGTYGGHVGKPPHPGTAQILKETGIPITGIKARQLRKEDLTQFTYVIGMDENNINHILSHIEGDTSHIRSFVDFIPQSTYTEVPDPYFTGDFEETYKLISTGCQYLLKEVKQSLIQD